MKFLTKIFGNEDIKDIENENRQLKRKRKVSQEELEQVQSELKEIKDKYIALLEEKGQAFDQYLHYEKLYGEYYNLHKEQKKEIADLKAENKKITEEKNELALEVEEQTNEIAKLRQTKGKKKSGK